MSQKKSTKKQSPVGSRKKRSKPEKQSTSFVSVNKNQVIDVLNSHLQALSLIDDDQKIINFYLEGATEVLLQIEGGGKGGNQT